MKKFIKVYINSEMEKDYKECADLYTDGIEKECNTCSCNGGDNIGCGSGGWCYDYVKEFINKNWNQ